VNEFNNYQDKNYTNWMNINNLAYTEKINGVSYSDLSFKADEIYQTQIEEPLLQFIDEMIIMGLDVHSKIGWLERYRPEFIKKQEDLQA